MKMTDYLIDLLDEQKSRIDAALKELGAIAFEDLLSVLSEAYTFDEIMVNIELLEEYFQDNYCRP